MTGKPNEHETAVVTLWGRSLREQAAPTGVAEQHSGSASTACDAGPRALPDSPVRMLVTVGWVKGRWS
ncbi:hypothetical protein [Streptomyces sp. NPDC087859]|uniref:hypothetical protein n=1 Tax=Streptomyces sp. NPDC087859 TaxID=3365812 RepID=UPI003829E865